MALAPMNPVPSVRFSRDGRVFVQERGKTARLVGTWERIKMMVGKPTYLFKPADGHMAVTVSALRVLEADALRTYGRMHRDR